MISVPVGSQVSGNVAAVYVDYNSVVKKGQLVAQIDPAPFQTKVDQAKANLDSAKAQISNAEVGVRKADLDIANAELNITNQKAAVVRSQSQVKDAQRKMDLQAKMFKDGVGTQDARDSAQAVYDQAVASLDSAQAQLKSAQANLESVKAQREVAVTQKVTATAQVATANANLQNAQLDLEHTRITSPVDGVVIARNTDVGQTVQASYSVATLFTIAQDLTKMQVETNIDESDISRVQQEQAATFTVDAYPGQTFRGTVMQVRHSPTNVQNVITYTVVIAVDNPDMKLFPGMTANVRLVTDHLSAVLKIPSAALRFRPPEDLLPADAKNDKKVAKGGDGKFDPSQFKGGDGKFDPSQFKGRGGGGGRCSAAAGAAAMAAAKAGALQLAALVLSSKPSTHWMKRACSRRCAFVPASATETSWRCSAANSKKARSWSPVSKVSGPARNQNKNNAPGFPGGGGGGRGRGGFPF